jgi:hypothetical protein
MKLKIDDIRWVPILNGYPELGVEVLGIVQHWNTKGKRIISIKKVNESDCEWRTADDNSEISYDWNVTHWMPVPDDWEKYKMDWAKDRIKDIEDNPDNHKHTFDDLQLCCTHAGYIDLSVMDAHRKYVNLGSNGGVSCDVIKGPCACGGWH